MAAPNIVNVSTISGKTAVQAVSTSATAIVTNSAASGKVYKVNSVLVSNVDGVNTAEITIDLYRSSTAYHLIKTASITAGSTLDLLAKTIYLEEGDSIRLTGSASSDLEAVCSYEEIDSTSSGAAGVFSTLTATGNTELGDAEATDTHAIKGATTLLANTSSDALRITQTGAGNALVVEDSANPDSTPFVITSSGQLLIGNTNAAANMALRSVLISNDGTASFSVDPSADDLVIDRETGGITIYGHNGSASGRITFGTATNNAIGSVVYFHTDNSMRFNVNGTEHMRIDSTGVVSVNTGYVTLNNNKVGGIQVTIADDAYAEITPPRIGAHFMTITEGGDETFPNSGCFGFVYADFGNSATVSEISVGPSFETSTSGPPTGTTGNDVHATLFVGGTSGKIYLENRLGFTGVFQITFL